MEEKNQETLQLLLNFIQSGLANNQSFHNWLVETLPEKKPSSDLKQIKEAFTKQRGSKKGRIFLEGCFDMPHSGHFNAMRKAKALSQELVMAVNADKDILSHKGMLPIMTETERQILVGACRWVDEVAGTCPYLPTIKCIDDANCQYIAHGDDIIVGPDGKSIYSEFDEQGRFK